MTRRDWLQLVASSAIGALATARPRAHTTARAAFAPDVDLVLTASPGEAAILPGARTKVWRFTGRLLNGPAGTLQPIPNSYLGPTIRLQRGQRVRIQFENQLPDPSIVHWHGLDVPERADGHPRLAVPGGSRYVYEFDVTNRAGTYWYHPHPHMQTGPQVYSGLAGLFVVTDDVDRSLQLPAGAHELLAVLQDRRFDAANQFVYSTAMMDMETGFLGDRFLVNGQLHPTWSVASRPYRLRILNGSNARIYKLGWSDGTPLTILGTDGGLMEHAVERRFLTLAPGQRADAWIDLSGRAVGTRLDLITADYAETDAGLTMGAGMRRGMGMGRGGVMAGAAALRLGTPAVLLSLAVARRESAGSRVPDRLSRFDEAWNPRPDVPVRRVPISFQAMEWKLGNRVFEMDGVAGDESVAAGSTHIWELANMGGPMGMQMAHPIHLHGRQFRVLGRSGGSPANSLRDGLLDSGWTDTVLVLPQESVRIQIPFSSHQGLFLYHCHILEHEDMGMMRNFRIGP